MRYPTLLWCTPESPSALHREPRHTGRAVGCFGSMLRYVESEMFQSRCIGISVCRTLFLFNISIYQKRDAPRSLNTYTPKVRNSDNDISIENFHTISQYNSLYISAYTRPHLLRRVAPYAGQGGQEVQSAVSALCYHGNFQADAVMKKKPIKARGTSGRTYTFAVPASAKKKAGRSSGPFAKDRAELVTKKLVPR